MWRQVSNLPGGARQVKNLPPQDRPQAVARVLPIFKLSATLAPWPSGLGNGLQIRIPRFDPGRGLSLRQSPSLSTGLNPGEFQGLRPVVFPTFPLWVVSFPITKSPSESVAWATNG